MAHRTTYVAAIIAASLVWMTSSASAQPAEQARPAEKLRKGAERAADIRSAAEKEAKKIMDTAYADAKQAQAEGDDARAREIIREGRQRARQVMRAGRTEAAQTVKQAFKETGVTASSPEAEAMRRERTRQQAWRKLHRRLQRMDRPPVMPNDLTPQVRAELRRHARRIASLRRIRKLALAAEDAATVERVDRLSMQEKARHIRRFESLADQLTDGRMQADNSEAP